MKDSSKQQKVGKGCAMAALGLFLVMGLMMTVGFAATLWDNLRSRFWDPTPCTILSSSFAQNETKDYVVEISYHYEFAGQAHTGTRFKPGGNKVDDVEEAQRVVRKYRSDQRRTCYVNASKPDECVLELGSPLEFLLILFPLVFVGIGGGGLIMLRRWKGAEPGAVSERRRANQNGVMILRIIGVIFTGAGAILVYVLTIKPWMQVRESAAWNEVPCVITSSRLESHRGSKSTTYSVEISYEYVVDGEKFTGTRYNFASGSSSSRGWKQRAVKAYPAGRRTVCYVNPADPLDSVLVRELGPEWWVAFLPAIFLLAGIGMLYGSVKAGTKETKRAVPVLSGAPVGALRGTIGEGAGPITLKPASSPLTGCIALGIVALFWNGLVWGILLGANLPTVAKVFLGFFGLIGLALIFGVVHQFLALFNPRPVLQADASSIRLGERLEIRYHFTGRTQRIERLKVTLKAEEISTYRRGTDTVTDKSPFVLDTLLDTQDRAQMQSGAVRIEIPATAMHTFDAPNNKITWSIEMHGEIPRWPDVKLAFPLTVLPLKLEPSAPAPV